MRAVAHDDASLLSEAELAKIMLAICSLEFSDLPSAERIWRNLYPRRAKIPLWPRWSSARSGWPSTAATCMPRC